MHRITLIMVRMVAMMNWEMMMEAEEEETSMIERFHDEESVLVRMGSRIQRGITI